VDGSIVSVNVGAPRTVEYGNKQVTTGIFKTPVNRRLAVRGVNVEGDDQADRSVHGGPDRAIYAYATEDYAWWQAELGRDLPPGQFGENLTTHGIPVNDALIGERWRTGTALLQVTTPRIPCYKLAMKMDDPHFIKRFGAALRPGTYLAIIEEGTVAQGDPIEVVSRPSHQISVAEMARIYLFERDRLQELLVPELPDEWRDWILQHTSA
jgi:MOSC domain-containing protein YiiM